MSDIEREQSVTPPESDITEPGRLHLEDKADQPDEQPADESARLASDAKVATRLTAQALERAGTVEHLAARRAVSELDVDTPEIKQRLTRLRTEVTRLLTSLRWENQSIEETADRLVPLLNVGPLPQWKSILIPFLHEIDRGGVLIPTWLYIVEQGDPDDLSPDANPAETMQGRARRFAILMLGNYRTMGITGVGKTARFANRGEGGTDIPQFLGQLALDPNTSLYATQALMKHATVSAMQALISALKDAKGWAKVDVIEACLELNQERFYDLILACGLEDVTGLESYVAIPIYRKIPLEHYLQNEQGNHSRLSSNAALIVNQVLQDTMTPAATPAAAETLPVIFERYLPPVAQALFAGARSNPTWQYTVAVHRLGIVLGRYWSQIAQGTLQDGRIIDQVSQCLPMMNDVERWMNGPGRDPLLNTIDNTDEDVPITAIKVIGDLRDPRAIQPIVRRIETINALHNRAQALSLGALCDTLGQLGDRRTVTPMFHLLNRTVDVAHRVNTHRRGDNLPHGHADIPGSIVYAAVVRATGNLGETSALDDVLLATRDFDPYVRTQALEALKRLDPKGGELRSRMAARAALDDPRDSVVRTACQLVVQYRDLDAISSLQRLLEVRPELSYLAQDALHQLRQ